MTERKCIHSAEYKRLQAEAMAHLDATGDFSALRNITGFTHHCGDMWNAEGKQDFDCPATQRQLAKHSREEWAEIRKSFKRKAS